MTDTIKKTTTRKTAAKRTSRSTTAQDTRLSLAHIQQEHTKYDELQKVVFADGRYTEIYTKFKPTEIETMLEQFADFIKEFQHAGNELREKDVLNYLNLHIILHFSTIAGTMPADIYEKMDLFQQILNSEYAQIILESFHQEEINKVYTYMQNKLEQYMKIAQLQEKMNGWDEPGK